MPKMIQIRHVPDALHRELKRRAAAQGMSLSEYLKRELAQVAEYRPWDEFERLLERLAPVQGGPPTVQLIEEGRAERDAELSARLGIPPE